MKRIFFIFNLVCIWLLFQPVAKATQTMALDQIRIGMTGHCRTVFMGTKVEPFGFKVLGVMNSMVGPKQDVILARLSGKKAEFTGVVSGMSGSPCYIEGKMIGALGYSFGQFTKEPIAGITPIANMTDVFKLKKTTSPGALGGNYQQQSFRQMFNKMANTKVPTDQELRPIATPFSFSGISPEVVKQYTPQLNHFGLQPVFGGKITQASTKLYDMPTSLEEGGAVAVMLVKGDVSAAGTCTVTYISGTKMLACGHPFFGQGFVEVPMATAYIVNTLASTRHSFKMSQPGLEVGAIVQDRLTAIYGEIGYKAPTIPVEINIRDSQNSLPKQVKFEVFRNPTMTPMMLLITAHGVLNDRLNAGLGGQLEMEGSIELGDRTLALKNYYSATEKQGTAIMAAFDLADKLFTIWNNPYRQPTIRKIQLNYTPQPTTRIATIQSVTASQEEVKPGDEVTINVQLKPYRGYPFSHEFKLTIPEDTPNGYLDVLISNGSSLDRLEGSVKTGVRNYNELLDELQKTRKNNQLYVFMITDQLGMSKYSQLMPKLPPSILEVLIDPASMANTVPLFRSPWQEQAIPMNYSIKGQGFTSFYVTAEGRHTNQFVAPFSTQTERKY